MHRANPKKTRPVRAKGNLEKRPDDWVTRNEPMTAAQAAYLRVLCEKSGEAFSAGLTKAEASKRIDSLRMNPWLERRAS